MGRPFGDPFYPASFVLSADAGLTDVEVLEFMFRAEDDLGNVGTRIDGDNRFQVYQSDLPPLDAPTGLTAQALPGGNVRLTWEVVEEATDYQLFRQGPTETALSEYQRTGGVLEFIDATTEDGLYRYAVASVRSANDQEAVSAYGNIVEVEADSIAPPAPLNLALELTGAGVRAQWEPPPGEGDLTYALYRSADAITSVEGLTPIRSGITELSAFDTAPSETEQTYAVTARDPAGNESPPSAPVILIIEVLPVASLEVVQADNDYPVVSWTHNGTNVDGYNIYLGEGEDRIKLNDSLLTELSYTDTGYTGDERVYSVTVVNTSGVESLERAVILPKLRVTLAEDACIYRGLMNQLQYQVTNDSSHQVDGIRLLVKLDIHEHNSVTFSLTSGESGVVPMVIGGYADLPDLSALETTIEVTQDSGETARVVRTSEIEVTDGSLVLTVLTEDFTRGSTGKARFSLENTSEVEIEVVTATDYGSSASGEINFKLLDWDENVLSTQSFKQIQGEGLVTRASGHTVARIPAGGTFTSEPVEIPVPLTAPDDVMVRLDIAQIHYHLDEPDEVSMQGVSTRQAVSLMDVAYGGEILSIAPQHSSGDEPILISGRAIDRDSGRPMPLVPLKLIIAVQGFERVYDPYTNEAGEFSFSFEPLAGESGLYHVSCIHPDLNERPIQGEFTIGRVTVSPTRINLQIPRNYEQVIPVNVTADPGTTATNVHLVYDEGDQPSGTFPAGVSLTLGDPISLGAGQSGVLQLTVHADASADDTGIFNVAVKSDESGEESLALIQVDYQFYDPGMAMPSLCVTPSHIETGVAHGGSVTETFTLGNQGLVDALDVQLALLMPDGNPVPDWIFLSSPAKLGDLPVGEERVIDIVAAPSASVAEGIYEFRLRVSSGNHAAFERSIYVSVTQAGIGNVLFHVLDIYTSTLDENGDPIQGVAGARIRVQNQAVLSVEHTLTTDSAGEALFNDLPVGHYKFRASAANHQEVVGRFWIKPGVTMNKEVFLDYNLVTVEWSVREITIEDIYEIVLIATYETNVPAPVVVIEPPSVNLPYMEPGDVYHGEFSLTNYGLVRADNLRTQLPEKSPYFSFELLGGIPDSLEAKQRVIVPYRVVCLKSMKPAGQESGGGGCRTVRLCTLVGYNYVCANSVVRHGGVYHCVLRTDCKPSQGTPPRFTVPPRFGGPITIKVPPGQGGGGGGGGGGQTYRPPGGDIEGLVCPPGCVGECCGDPGGGNGPGDG